MARENRRRSTDPAHVDPGHAGRHEQVDDHLKALVAELVNQKVEQKLAQTEQKLERKLAEAERKATAGSLLKAEVLERVGSALDVWTRQDPGSRRAKFSRDDIAAAAVRIADAEGLRAMTMRRLATELDVGTMTLYHYVRTKDELLSLVTDAVLFELIIPDDEPPVDGWRENLKVLARRSKAALERHPWMLDITDDPPVGPNGVRHFDQTLRAVAEIHLPLGQKLDLVSAVDEYTFGYCIAARQQLAEDEHANDEMLRYVQQLLATGDYPSLQALADEHGLEESWAEVEAHQRDPHRFERNLDRLLDGIAAALGLTDGGTGEPTGA